MYFVYLIIFLDQISITVIWTGSLRLTKRNITRSPLIPWEVAWISYTTYTSHLLDSYFLNSAIFPTNKYLDVEGAWTKSVAIFMQWSGRWKDFVAGLIDRNLNHFRFWLIWTAGHSDAETACCDELEWSRDRTVSPALIPLLIAPPMLSNGSLHQLWIRVNRFKQLCHNPNWIPQTFWNKNIVKFTDIECV